MGDTILNLPLHSDLSSLRYRTGKFGLNIGYLNLNVINGCLR
uniref:Uncharacterized protein n=1 Tax=Arundo donax TaxID=35708 RepID=A0A0A9DTX4_ARUDO